jgi:hypothetical protein
VPFKIIVFPSAIVIGPADIPLVLAGIVMFSLIVFALVLIILAVPSDGPPRATAELIFAAVTEPSFSSLVPTDSNGLTLPIYGMYYSYAISRMLAKTSKSPATLAVSPRMSPASRLIGLSIRSVASAGTGTVLQI